VILREEDEGGRAMAMRDEDYDEHEDLYGQE